VFQPLSGIRPGKSGRLCLDRFVLVRSMAGALL
jgi:hypothetical protein